MTPTLFNNHHAISHWFCKYINFVKVGAIPNPLAARETTIFSLAYLHLAQPLDKAGWWGNTFPRYPPASRKGQHRYDVRNCWTLIPFPCSRRDIKCSIGKTAWVRLAALLRISKCPSLLHHSFRYCNVSRWPRRIEKSETSDMMAKGDFGNSEESEDSQIANKLVVLPHRSTVESVKR